MNKEMVCIICPRGCRMTATVDGDKVTVSGNACPRGEEYAINECTNPVRTVTSIVRVDNRTDTMVSVKTEAPIAKANIFDAMKVIREATVSAPVTIGQVIIKDLYGTNVIATKNID